MPDNPPPPPTSIEYGPELPPGFSPAADPKKTEGTQNVSANEEGALVICTDDNEVLTIIDDNEADDNEVLNFYDDHCFMFGCFRMFCLLVFHRLDHRVFTKKKFII